MPRGRESSAVTERATRSAASRKASAATGRAKAEPARQTAAGKSDSSDDACSSSGSEDENQPPVRRSARLQPAPQAKAAPGAKAAPAPAAIDLAQSSSGEESSSEDEEGSGGRLQAQPAAGRGARGGGRGGRRYAASRLGKAKAASTRGAAAAAAAEPAAMQDSDQDGSSSSDGEQEEEDGGAGPSSRAAAGKAGPSRPAASLKRSALELISGKLDEESMKRLARERPDSINFNLKDALNRRLQACGYKWRSQLRSGNSLLLYGFGSKFALLDQWARQVLTDGAVVVVHGFNPAVTAKQVAQAAASVIVPGSVRGLSATDIIRAIQRQPVDPEEHVYLILHNIDGPGLRSAEDQALLAELSSCPGVHLAASVDHINAPLMWDVKTCARFRWVYQDATTFAPHFSETLDMPSVLLACFQETTRRGASTALGSMPPTAQAVFRVLADAQLDDPTSPGLTFATLFRMCRERWLVTNEQALRGFLAEFTDHELVSERMALLHGEEQEVLYVPMKEDVLRKLLEVQLGQG